MNGAQPQREAERGGHLAHAAAAAAISAPTPSTNPAIVSATLAALDQAIGRLREIGTFPYDGILPEAAVFDASGNHLAVATYDHFDDRKPGGSIDFWRIQADPLDPNDVQLVRTSHSVEVTRGVHSIAIAR